MRWRMQGQQQITIRFEIYKRDNVYRRVQKNGDPTTCYGYAQCGIVFRKVIFCKRHGTVSQISIFDRFPIKTLELSTKKTKKNNCILDCLFLFANDNRTFISV